MTLHRIFKAALTALALTLVASRPLVAQTLRTELVGTSPGATVYAVSPPGDTERLFVVGRGGIIRILKGGVTLATPFLNIVPLTSSGGERGLLGLAFHPDYANNGRFFVNYTNTAGDTRVVEYAVSATDPDVADPTPVQTIYEQNQPFSNHNGGCMAFGPDGKLYIGMGDGGSGNDPGNRSQNPATALGKMLRLDVDLPAPFVPADNPFVGDPSTLDEVWALGLRNPWRFCFDPATGDLYIADVGQNAREEVNFVTAASTGGENYGWRCMEGDLCTGLSGCTCDAPELTMPIHVYGHGGGRCSVTGGFVYRSDEIPNLQGTYFFADFCSSQIWSFRIVAGAVTELTDRTAELAPATGSITSVSSFGQDALGNVYICQLSGEIHKIVAGCNTDNYCTSTVNSSGSAASITNGGTTSVAANDFLLLGRNVPAGVVNIFYYGPTRLQLSLGDGLRCVGGRTARLQAPLADAQGNVVRPLDFNAPPLDTGPNAITPGSTWNFQLWFRDPGGPGGTGFNLSDGLSVAFCP